VIIQFIYQMSGGRYDDRAFPPPWTDFEVPDEEGNGLIYCGAAVRVTRAAAPEPEPEPVKLSEPVSEPVLESSFRRAPEPEPAVVKELPQPAPADPKAAWVDYAVSRGATRAEAEDQTKAQLQAMYGGRL
jgi:hypothetical protein